MMRLNMRRNAPRLAAVGLCLPLLFGACSKSNDTAATTADNNQSTTTTAAAINAGPTIDIPATKFEPDSATAKVGQVVTWKNSSASTHQVQEQAQPGQKPKFESQLLKPDNQYVFTPTEPGTYQYICRIHPQEMQGTLTVTP